VVVEEVDDVLLADVDDVLIVETLLVEVLLDEVVVDDGTVDETLVDGAVLDVTVDEVLDGEGNVVPVAIVVVVVGDISGMGHTSPAGRGMQASVSTFLSIRLRCSAVVATILIFRFRAFRPWALSFTRLSVKGPHAELARAGTLTADFGFTFTFRSGAGLHPVSL
jgi:hypothetical protein